MQNDLSESMVDNLFSDKGLGLDSKMKKYVSILDRKKAFSNITDEDRKRSQESISETLKELGLDDIDLNDEKSRNKLLANLNTEIADREANGDENTIEPIEKINTTAEKINSNLESFHKTVIDLFLGNTDGLKERSDQLQADIDKTNEKHNEKINKRKEEYLRTIGEAKFKEYETGLEDDERKKISQEDKERMIKEFGDQYAYKYKKDKDGNPLRDENGNTIYETDENGNLIANDEAKAAIDYATGGNGKSGFQRFSEETASGVAGIIGAGVKTTIGAADIGATTLTGTAKAGAGIIKAGTNIVGGIINKIPTKKTRAAGRFIQKIGNRIYSSAENVDTELRNQFDKTHGKIDEGLKKIGTSLKELGESEIGSSSYRANKSEIGYIKKYKRIANVLLSNGITLDRFGRLDKLDKWYNFDDESALLLTEATDAEWKKVYKFLKDRNMHDFCKISFGGKFNLTGKNTEYLFSLSATDLNKLKNCCNFYLSGDNVLFGGAKKYISDFDNSFEAAFNKFKSDKKAEDAVSNENADTQVQTDDAQQDEVENTEPEVPGYGIGTAILGGLSTIGKGLWTGAKAVGKVAWKGAKALGKVAWKGAKALGKKAIGVVGKGARAIGSKINDMTGGVLKKALDGIGKGASNIFNGIKDTAGKLKKVDKIGPGPNDYGIIKEKNDGSFEPDTSDSKTKEILDRVTKSEKEENEAAQAQIRMEEQMNKITAEPTAKEPGLLGRILGFGLKAAIIAPLIKPLYENVIKPIWDNVVVPLWNNSIKPALKYLAEEILAPIGDWVLTKGIPELITAIIKAAPEIGTAIGEAIAHATGDDHVTEYEDPESDFTEEEKKLAEQGTYTDTMIKKMNNTDVANSITRAKQANGVTNLQGLFKNDNQQEADKNATKAVNNALSSGSNYKEIAKRANERVDKKTKGSNGIMTDDFNTSAKDVELMSEGKYRSQLDQNSQLIDYLNFIVVSKNVGKSSKEIVKELKEYGYNPSEKLIDIIYEKMNTCGGPLAFKKAYKKSNTVWESYRYALTDGGNEKAAANALDNIMTYGDIDSQYVIGWYIDKLYKKGANKKQIYDHIYNQSNIEIQKNIDNNAGLTIYDWIHTGDNFSSEDVIDKYRSYYQNDANTSGKGSNSIKPLSRYGRFKSSLYGTGDVQQDEGENTEPEVPGYGIGTLVPDGLSTIGKGLWTGAKAIGSKINDMTGGVLKNALDGVGKWASNIFNGIKDTAGELKKVDKIGQTSGQFNINNVTLNENLENNNLGATLEIIEKAKQGQISIFSNTYWANLDRNNTIAAAYNAAMKVMAIPSIVVRDTMRTFLSDTEFMANEFRNSKANSSNGSSSNMDNLRDSSSGLQFSWSIDNNTLNKRALSDDIEDEKKKDGEDSKLKDTGKAAASAAKAASDAAKKASNSSSSSGKGKYGRGLYSKQIDPKISSIRFNSSGDSEYQTIGNSGCGPAAAVNALEAMYGMGSRDIVSAANFAVDRGYKERDGGTKPGFFRDYFNRHGYCSQTTSSKQQLASNIRSGMPTVLMGRDARGTSTSTPYGRTPHYVTVTGTDARGRAIVQDPESKYDNQLYDMNDLLNKSQFGVSTYGRGGKQQQQLTHMQMAAISADVVYGQILKSRCKHSFGSKVKEFSEIPKYKTIHCSRSMDLVLQGAGCLGRRLTTGHTKAKPRRGAKGIHGKTTKSKAIKNYNRLKNCEIYKSMCKYKNLPAKYKQKGVAYIYNSNAAVSGGNGVIYSCNSTGRKYTHAGMIKQRGGYPHNAIILFCIKPDDKVGASCDPNILAHKGISVPEDKSTGSPAKIDSTSQNLNGSADAIQDSVDNATDTGAPASTALTFTTTTGEEKTIGSFLADTLANSNIGRVLSSFTELSSGATTETSSTDTTTEGGTTVGEDGFSGSSGDIVTGSGDFPKYNLNDKQLRGIANILKHEQPGKSGMMAEASQLANLTDINGDNKATPENIVKKATGGWYRNGSSRYNAGTNDKTAIEAARQVLIEGKRTLPRYVDEHDYLGDIVSVKTNGSPINKKDVSKYVPHKTVIRNTQGSTYTFYTQPNKNADPFGYTSEKLRKKWGDNHYTVDGTAPTSSGGFGSFARYGMGPDDTMAQIGSTLADTLNNSNIGRTLGSILDVGSSSTTSSDTSMGDTTSSSTGTTSSSSSSSSMSVGSGDGADVIRAAQAELGYKEKGENRTKFGEWYGMNGQPWCAMFVSWSANKAGIPTSIIPKYASVKDGFSRIKKMGATKIDKFSDAKAGDIFFNVNGGSHTGLVEGWDGKKLRTIEGNSGDKVSAREYSPGDSAVDYIYRPNYANKSGSSVKISDVTKDGIDPSSYANTRGSNGMKPMSKYGMFRSSLYGKGRSMPPPQKIRVKDANGYFTIETHPEDRMLDLQAKSINNRIRNRYGTGNADTRLINTIINILYSIADNTDKLNTIVAILNSKLGTKITSNDISNNTGMETLKAKLQNSLNNVTNTATSKMNAYADSIGDFSINTVIQAMNAIASE